MKRILSILIIVALLLSCSGCANPLVSAAGVPGHEERPLHGEEPQVPVRPAPEEPEEENRVPVPEEPSEQGGGTELPEEPEDAQQPGDAQQPEEPYVRTVDPTKPMVALTFDDGPHAVYSDMILDILEENHAVATFFEVGRNVANCPGPLSRMVELGCEIGSHSNAHNDLSKLKASTLEKDLATADQAFINAVGFAPTLLRPPYGAVNKAVKYNTGRSVITWTVDTEDWMSQDAEKVVSYVQSLEDLDGEIVLLHSIYESTVEAVRVLIPWLIEEGYQLVTVSELMAYYYGDLPEPGEFFGYTYFNTHGRTDTPVVLPDGPAGENEAEASDSTSSGEEAAPPANQGTQAGEPDSGTDSGASGAEGDVVVLDGSGQVETAHPEKPEIPPRPAAEGTGDGAAPADGTGEEGPAGNSGGSGQPSSL